MRLLHRRDERKSAQVLSSALGAEHYDIIVAQTGEDGFFRANAEVFDQQFDDQLHDDFETAAGFLTSTGDGRVAWGTTPPTSDHEHATQRRGGHA